MEAPTTHLQEQMELDLVVRNGKIVSQVLSDEALRFSLDYSKLVLSPQVNASDVLEDQEIGIKDGKIVCIGTQLPSAPSTTFIDAEGGYITPGGSINTNPIHQKWH